MGLEIDSKICYAVLDSGVISRPFYFRPDDSGVSQVPYPTPTAGNEGSW
jgi:hypothetical protein